MGSVLIIDADDGFANDLVSVLSSRGVDVQVTPDGKAGLDLARINIPDAIVLCVELPRMSGYSICAKLKKDVQLKTVPLIITSAEATQETFEHHKKLKTRAEEYMKKPFAPEELVSVLSGYVPMSNGADHDSAIAEDLSIDDDATPATLNDDEVFAADESDGMLSIDQEIQNLRQQKLPPHGLNDHGALNDQGFEDDEGMTTLGGAPSAADFQAVAEEVEKQAEELRKLKAQVAQEKESRSKAERERDLAVANERAATAQLQKMGSSQPPTAASASREALELKKQVNAKERELLDLRNTLHEKDKELLGQREREMELESKIVEAEEATQRAEQSRQQLEAKLAALEARSYEIERSSSAKIEDLNRQLSEMNTQAAELDSSVQSLTQELHEARDDIEVLSNTNHQLNTKNQQLNNELNASRSEASKLRESLGDVEDQARDLGDQVSSLRASLDSANSEINNLKSTIDETEDRLSRAYQKIREDEEVKAKAKKALEIASALLVEAGFSADADSDEIDKMANG
jgi:DNA-binding response OmpR family regulator/predicted  nucleic acid-binding Zn-ribbon protein